MSKTTIELKELETFETVDGQTGEIAGIEKKEKITLKTVHKPEPPYIKIYIADMLYLSDIPKGLSPLVYSLLKRTNFADSGLRVDLTGYVKKEILAECKWAKMQSLNNALVALTKGKIIKRLGTGSYQFNPFWFGRGNWKDIDNIRVNWYYDDVHGRTFQTHFNYRKETDPVETSETPIKPIEPLTESPETHETPSEQENIPGKLETSQNEQNETKLAKLKGTVKQIVWAEKIREKFYRQFSEQIPLYDELSDEPLEKLFATENRAKFWLENRDKNLENLPR